MTAATKPETADTKPEEASVTYNMGAARAKWHSARDGSVKAKKKAEDTLAAVVDGRSLRATGRTAQFNFRCTPDLKSEVKSAAAASGLDLAEWMERVLKSALEGKA